jgi:hypothetical protein
MNNGFPNRKGKKPLESGKYLKIILLEKGCDIGGTIPNESVTNVFENYQGARHHRGVAVSAEPCVSLYSQAAAAAQYLSIKWRFRHSCARLYLRQVPSYRRLAVSIPVCSSPGGGR